VEMGLKALITLKKGQAPRIHSIHDLAQIAAEFYPEMKNSFDSLKDLEPYYIASRYFDGLPDGIPIDHLSQKDGERAAEIARNFIMLASEYFR
jgi:HEPN domain-containing protein